MIVVVITLLIACQSVPGRDVQILVRVRPFSDAELKLGSQSSVTVHTEKQLSLLPHSEATQYVFDRVLKGDTSQQVVFDGMVPLYR
jgi:hypothetical protein